MSESIRHYFVDEHGDGTLFDRKGRVIVGTDGCSEYFALGVLDVSAPDELTKQLNALRESIIADPYFHGVESLKPERCKTARCFHAKDDLPEIRQQVFKVLAFQDVAFQAVVRSKHALVHQVRNSNKLSESYRYTPNRLYDEMVKRLFKNLLHKADGYRICFATRGQKDRTAALQTALADARRNFRKAWGIAADAPIEVVHADSSASAPLQAVDYFLWALQRVYTKGEDRFLRALWPKVSLIVDADDRRKSPAGVYYNSERALTAEMVKKEPGI